MLQRVPFQLTSHGFYDTRPALYVNESLNMTGTDIPGVTVCLPDAIGVRNSCGEKLLHSQPVCGRTVRTGRSLSSLKVISPVLYMLR